MARSDLLISLVRTGRGSPDPRFRSAVEALIAEERAKRHGSLADQLFDHARQRQCVLFFDEFDTVGKERGDAHETGEIKRVVSTLLLQMDQLPAHVVIVTATNHAELLDRAVWRRFQLRLHLPAPRPKQIDEFLGRLFAGLKLGAKVKLPSLGRQLQNATFSEVEELFRDVSRRAVLDGPDAGLHRILKDRIECWKHRETASSARPKTEKVSANSMLMNLPLTLQSTFVP